ncbi:MAG TPA: hypothetical protein DDW52_00715 [Planctomycetaceae bacterium]|nr:hypothetical protein [Planctomycetaceae bacterium]
MARRANFDASVGEDSFLDTTANLVGILIILVVVVGAKTRVDAEAYQRSLVEQSETEVDGSELRALDAARKENVIDLIKYNQELQYREAERSNLLVRLAVAKEQVEEELIAVDDAKRESIQRQRKIAKLEAELDAIADQMGSDTEQPRPTVVLEHLPTPMAKTVFNREMHIQIKDQKITVIPWEQLVDMLKQHIPLAARRQASRSQLQDTLGPVGGFVMHYMMQSVPGGFELDHFDLEVLDSAPRETIEQALAPTGRFSLELASRQPSETVVTAWVYPDSFDTFRTLKARLFKEGFLAAARPLPDGQSIGASPRGTRSTAQ